VPPRRQGRQEALLEVGDLFHRSRVGVGAPAAVLRHVTEICRKSGAVPIPPGFVMGRHSLELGLEAPQLDGLQAGWGAIGSKVGVWPDSPSAELIEVGTGGAQPKIKGWDSPTPKYLIYHLPEILR
jgi:hypothetical protein